MNFLLNRNFTILLIKYQAISYFRTIKYFFLQNKYNNDTRFLKFILNIRVTSYNNLLQKSSSYLILYFENNIILTSPNIMRTVVDYHTPEIRELDA